MQQTKASPKYHKWQIDGILNLNGKQSVSHSDLPSAAKQYSDHSRKNAHILPQIPSIRNSSLIKFHLEGQFMNLLPSRKGIFATIVATATLVLPTISSASTVDGANLASTANVALPNGNGTNVGTSVQFTGSPTDQVLVNIDLSAMNFGVGAGQASSGSVTIDSTRITSDSDWWVGVWDGSVFSSVTYWDGNRSAAYTGGSIQNGGTTFTDSGFDASINLSSAVAVGDSTSHTINFDFAALTLGNTINGQTIRTGFAIDAAFDATGPLSFIIGKGSTGETLQIDSITVDGALAAVPVPASLPLLLAGLVGFAAVRRRKPA